MTWTSCFNVNVFVSSSYLLIHLLSSWKTQVLPVAFLGKAGLDRICSIYFSFSLEMKILQKNLNREVNGDWITIWDRTTF